MVTKSQVREFNEAREEYGEFHKQLAKFVDELPSRFKGKVPASLSNVTSLPDVLKADSADFSVNLAAEMIKAARATLQAAERFLDVDNMYVDCWLEAKKHTLTPYMEVCSKSLVEADCPENPFTVKIDVKALKVEKFASSTASKDLKAKVEDYLKALQQVA